MPAMVTTLLALVFAAAAVQTPADEKLPLKVLYAGNADTPYTAAWTKFLGEHTASVKFVSGSAVTRADLTGFDVLVIDGETTTTDEKGNPRLKTEKVQLTLDELQGFPVLLMGGQGGFVSDELKLKTSWRHG